MKIKELKLYSDSNGKIKGDVISSIIEVTSWDEYVDKLNQNMEEFDVKNHGIFSMKLTDSAVIASVKLRNGEFMQLVTEKNAI